MNVNRWLDIMAVVIAGLIVANVIASIVLGYDGFMTSVLLGMLMGATLAIRASPPAAELERRQSFGLAIDRVHPTPSRTFAPPPTMALDFVPEYDVDEIYELGQNEPVVRLKRCRHANTVPVTSPVYPGEILARLCTDCDEQLDA